ncbi:MAG: class I SAM-dependent methyltransferase [Pirellulales bacterium]
MLASSYTSEYVRQYAEVDFEPFIVEIRRRELLKSAQLYSHRRVLEIGCALEPLYPYLDGFDSYTIVEPSVEMSRTVAAAAADARNVRVVNATLQDSVRELREGAFDFIVCSSVLHEVGDPKPFLSALRAVCDARTVCHLNVPNAASFHRLLAVEMGLIERVDEPSARDRRFGHNAVFNRESLRTLLGDSGFRVLRDGTFFIKPFTHDQMSMLLNQRIVPETVVDGLYRMSKYFPDHGCELFLEVQAAPERGYPAK